MLLSEKVRHISPSPTLSITAKANKMKAEGINVIGFGAGEPLLTSSERAEPQQTIICGTSI